MLTLLFFILVGTLLLTFLNPHKPSRFLLLFVMKPHKRVFLKTYGKHKKKLSAWILPDCRKQAFDSTLSTDGDQSVFEPSKAMKKM